MPFAVMFRLCSIDRLNPKFLVLQDQSVLCPSCIFAHTKRTNWRHGKRAYGSIRKVHHVKPGDGTICDQTMSAQPGLVPRMGGRHTKDRITAVSVFLDSVTGHSFSHLQISTGGDETLAAKRVSPKRCCRESYWSLDKGYSYKYTSFTKTLT